MPVSRSVRSAVIARAYGCCEYCRSLADYATEPFHVEHIIPVSRGGTDDPENLALACPGCNIYKNNKITGFDPLSNTYARLFDPRKDVWEEHFSWSSNLREIQGKTPAGRATVLLLKLNRKPLTKLRKVLIAAGEHPPVFHRC